MNLNIFPAIPAIVAGIIRRAGWKRRKKLPTDAFYNAFCAGWGIGRLLYEWINLPKSDVASNFLEMASQVQPFFDTLGLDVDLLVSFKKVKFSNDIIPFISQIENKIYTEFGNDAGHAFELGQALALNTKDIYKYATDDSHRTMVESQDTGLSSTIAAIDEPLSKLHLGKVIEKEWADIVSSIKANKYDKNKLRSTIQAWIKRVHYSMGREAADKMERGGVVPKVPLTAWGK